MSPDLGSVAPKCLLTKIHVPQEFKSQLSTEIFGEKALRTLFLYFILFTYFATQEKMKYLIKYAFEKCDAIKYYNNFNIY